MIVRGDIKIFAIICQKRYKIICKCCNPVEFSLVLSGQNNSFSACLSSPLKWWSAWSKRVGDGSISQQNSRIQN